MATRFSLTEPNPGVWFAFDEDDPDSGRICLRIANQAERDKIRKATRTQKDIFRQGQRFEVEKIDDDLFSEMLWDYCIVDWERLEDDDEMPIECTKENKLKLMKEHVGFQMFIGQCIEKLNDEIEAKLDLTEKN